MNEGNPNIHKYGEKTQFSKTNQPKKHGRRPSSLKKYFKENKTSATDKIYLFENIISRHTAQELMDMVKTKNFPDGKPMSGLVWGFVVAWMADIKKGWSSGGINVIMMERKHGKTPDIVKVSGKIDFTNMTKEDRIKRIKELEEIARARKKELEDKKDEKNHTD